MKKLIVVLLVVFIGQTLSSQNLSKGKIHLDCKINVNLSKGNTFSGVFYLENEQFLFSYNSFTGLSQIWNLKRGGLPVYQKKWTTGWSNFNFYEYKGENYFFLQKSSEGTARIIKLDYQKIMTSKSLGAQVYNKKWSSGWTSTKFFVHNNLIYFLHYKKGTGLIRLNAITKGGTVGSVIYEKKWSKGYTNFAMTATSNKFFILSQKEKDGLCVINRVDVPKLEQAAKLGFISPNLGTEIYRKKWSSGWSNFEFFKLKGKTYLFFNKNKGGTVRIEEFLSNGYLSKRVYDNKWSNGWSEIDIFDINGKPQLFHQKKSTGQTKICELKI
ncbi:hypothetical protein [uncultured Polaribacter sp.]|uniref:hypothetical protein n=1 Tax=uncultured Polaribacter sp. TaxID=174711 RepID=UPI002606FBCB|nr:hypothetical protein [uncultured Polaribacter sp.]